MTKRGRRRFVAVKRKEGASVVQWQRCVKFRNELDVEQEELNEAMVFIAHSKNGMLATMERQQQLCSRSVL